MANGPSRRQKNGIGNDNSDGSKRLAKVQDGVHTAYH